MIFSFVYTPMSTTKPNHLTGISLMIAAMACFAIMNVAIRQLAAGMDTTQMVFLRNASSFALIIAWSLLLWRGNLHRLKTRKLYGHFWRAAIGFSAMEIWFYALSILPLTTATALSFTTPVFGTVFATLLLKEKAGWRRALAIAASFGGVLVIMRPGENMLEIAAATVLASSALMALAGVVVKSLTRTEPPETIVFYMGLFMTPLSLPPALVHWQPVTGPQWQLIIIIAVFSTAAHLLLTRAYRHADMVVLLPFDFTRLLFTAALAYVIFGEQMDHYTLAGALIIMASSIYIVHRERLRRATPPL